MKREDLIKTAEDLNETLGIEPAIDIKANANILKSKISKAFELIEPEDTLKDSTINTLRELGLWVDQEEENTNTTEEEETIEETQEEEEEEEEEEEPKPAKKAKPAKKVKKEESKNVKKTEKKAKKDKPAKKGKGIIATIVELIEKSGKKGISKEEILQELENKFPDRAVDSMKNTINVQVPNRISKEKFELEKTKEGKFKKV